MSGIAAQGVYGMWVLLRAQQLASRGHAVACGRDTSGQMSTQVDHSSTRPPTFEEVGHAAFGNSGRRLVAICVLALQLGVCAVIIGLLATNLQTEARLSKLCSVGIVYVPCAALSQLPDLSSLWPLSLFGNLAMLLALTSTVVAAAIEMANASEPLPFTREDPSFKEVVATVSSAFYAFEGVALVLPVGNEIDRTKAQKYPSILVTAMCTVGSVFVLVGGVSGLGFPDNDSASVTAYLEKYYGNTSRSIYFHFINIVVTVAALTAFPLQLTPAAEVVDAGCGLRTHFSRRLARFLLVSGCAGLVAAVDTLDSLIDIIGGVANTLLAALPFLLHTALLLRARKAECVPLAAVEMLLLGLNSIGLLVCFSTLILSLATTGM
mmetsp:Transcript_28872/g.62100  ORF Transcript_28872/g.62100 Transcript_28872/m.62100 type:complete len:379 (-) Transcript_28872:352-1488(-)|eukprot:CAMPEP_0183377582 /NCGR_PEP_ID=MMETSP0164_2-20130417/123406_1 /TAXON_ID=221442 /ORGANISM="Coccolithus pelagicus ssp braarudi, Strain PLY182g" /LENGTH=378 /DNA_ID=CAMNT_0025555043 /DNA_START=109 /DNA_END=1245 /DNA_ORIENTATION=-